MGKIEIRNQRCINPNCSSSDAMQVYENGSAYCFSCKSSFRKDQIEGKNVRMSDKPAEGGFTKLKVPGSVSLPSIEEIGGFATKGIPERDISKEVCEFFRVKMGFNSDGEVDTHFYPYEEGTSYKVRKLPKNFLTIGGSITLFGYDRFKNQGGKRLIIVEGEIDTLATAQALYTYYNGVIYPVIGLPSAASVKKLLDYRTWIRSFDEVVLCLDNDKAGQEATEAAVKIVGVDKAKIAALPEKDPDLTRAKHGNMGLLRAIWDARQFVPAGIIRKDALWEALVRYNEIPSLPYPPCLAGINDKLKGKRQGEITLFVSGTGSGKSTLLREDILHTLETTPTEDKIGIISLEEAPAETARKLAGMAIKRNPIEFELTQDELKAGFDKVFGSDRIILLDHQGSINDSKIIDQLEYMALAGCKHIYVDHITILVSEGAEGLSGNEAIDKVMNDLLRLVKRYPVWIGLVSHLRKVSSGTKSFEQGALPSLDDIKGSGSIKQICFDIVGFARDLTSEDERQRNTIMMTVLKARTTGRTGPVPGAYYDITSGRLLHIDEAPKEEFTKIE